MNAFTIPQREATEEIACGSHIPVFKALAPVFKPRRVLELGSGLCSTPMFLDREIFPDLETLVSIENDPVWRLSVGQACGDDDRLTLVLIDEPVATFASKMLIDSFSLVFFDDSRSGAERCETIRAVGPQMPHNAVAVIHDYEEKQYQDASMVFDNQFIFDWLNPATGVCWNGFADHTPTLEALRSGPH